jgi:DNA-directed RNA polymerase sigma subunit (sigma70/sigma32)
MGDPLSFMNEDGWPYPDDDDVDEQLEPIDLRAEADDDMVALHALPRNVVLDLTSTERTVIALRFGFDGRRPSTLSEMHDQLGMSRSEIRAVLVDGITKLRTQIT